MDQQQKRAEGYSRADEIADKNATEPRYTEAEYAKAALAADVAEHEATGLAELNDRQAREIRQLKAAAKWNKKHADNLEADRDRWKQLRYEALEGIQFWKKQAAIRMCISARETLRFSGNHSDEATADRDKARDLLAWGIKNAEIAGKV